MYKDSDYYNSIYNEIETEIWDEYEYFDAANWDDSWPDEDDEYGDDVDNYLFGDQ